jgi:hypothetical protein
VVELARMCVERVVDITQAIFLADMGEHHAHQLMPVFEVFGPIIPVVFIRDAGTVPITLRNRSEIM